VVKSATANSPLKILYIDIDENSRAILGVGDGNTSISVETEKDKQDRKQFLRNIGYKR